MTKLITCASCGEVKPHLAKGLCSKCYNKRHYENNKEKICNQNKEWKKNNSEYQKLWVKNHPNYSNDWKHKNNKCQPYNQNKSCSSYLGVHVAEQVLSKVFENVNRMINNNPGYDFICNKGYKVDVKASCRNITKNKSDRWLFNIRKNQIPDYFLCLAFDNRTDLNPLYIWLVPGLEINMKGLISISESKLNRWNNYKLDIDKVISQCNKLKTK